MQVLLAFMALAVLNWGPFLAQGFYGIQKANPLVARRIDPMGSSNSALPDYRPHSLPRLWRQCQRLFTYSDSIVVGSPTYARPIANGSNPPNTLSAQNVRYSLLHFH